MRILHIGKYYPPYAGGMENFMADLLPASQKIGVENFALVHAHQHSGIERDAAGVEIIRVPSHGRLLYAPLSPLFPFWLERALQRIRPDVLHFHLPNTSAFWALRSRAARAIPWVIHWHSDVVATRLDWRLKLAYPPYRPFEQALLKRAIAIVATSPPYLEASQALKPWRSKCQVIPLGLNPARYARVDELRLAWAEAQWRPGRLRILAIGRMTYYKGHEVLLRAMAGLPGAHLILVGGGEQRETLVELARNLQLEDRVSFAGRCSDAEVAALLASCEVFCLPSIERTEAFGMVLLEAMLHGKALVASDIPGSGVGWVAQHERTGLLFEPGNDKMLSQTLQRLQDAPQLRQALGKAGRERFIEEFQIDAVAVQVQALYRQVKQ